MAENEQELKNVQDEEKTVTSDANLPEGIKVGNNRSGLKYYCMFCECFLNSESSISSHIKGFRHKQKGKFVKTGERKFVPSQNSKKSTKVSQKLKLYLEKISTPVIGLNYIIELQIPDSEPKYECSLCEAKGSGQMIVQHIVSNNHRLKYLKTINEEEYNMIKEHKLQDQTELIVSCASKLEKERGQGVIQVKRIASKLSNTKTKPNLSSLSHSISRGYLKRQTNIRNRKVIEMKNSRNTFGEKNKIKPRKRKTSGNYPSNKRQNYFGNCFNDENYLHGLEIPYEISSINSEFRDNIGSSVELGNDLSKHIKQNSFEVEVLKHLNNFSITNDDDAETVTEVINSLTHSLIQYKLRNLSAPIRELVLKSIKAEGIKNEKLGLDGLMELKKVDSLMSNYDTNSRDVKCNDFNERFEHVQDKQFPSLLDGSFCHAMNKDLDNKMRRPEVCTERFNQSFHSSQSNYYNSLPSTSNLNTRNFTDDFNQQDGSYDSNKYDAKQLCNNNFKKHYEDNNFRGRSHDNDNFNSFNEKIKDNRYNNSRPQNNHFSSRKTTNNQYEHQNTDFGAESYRRISDYESSNRYSRMDNNFTSWKNYGKDYSNTHKPY
ncbi:ras-related protein RabX-like [Centruroides vittatus]|uniref:ras-related protein RabX-like n=1 Tax=Centruroides vittatus TaxID=120091 RepID=UPI00350E8E19